jgi:hypothetical protein
MELVMTKVHPDKVHERDVTLLRIQSRHRQVQRSIAETAQRLLNTSIWTKNIFIWDLRSVCFLHNSQETALRLLCATRTPFLGS